MEWLLTMQDGHDIAPRFSRGCHPLRFHYGKHHAPSKLVKVAVFIERDGILSETIPTGRRPRAPHRVEEFRVREWVRPAIEELRSAGLLIIVTSNQPAISRGEMSRRELDLMHRILQKKLPVDDIACCLYDDPSHPCFKPQPGLFIESAFKWSIDLDRSFVISDHAADAKAAQIAGCTSVLIQSPWIGSDHHDFVVADFETAVRKVLQLQAASVARAVYA